MLRSSGGSAVTSRSAKRTVPSVGRNSPEMMFSKVVLPQPEGPSKALALPASHSRSRRLRAQSASLRGWSWYVCRMFASLMRAMPCPPPLSAAAAHAPAIEREVEPARDVETEPRGLPDVEAMDSMRLRNPGAAVQIEVDHAVGPADLRDGNAARDRRRLRGGPRHGNRLHMVRPQAERVRPVRQFHQRTLRLPAHHLAQLDEVAALDHVRGVDRRIGERARRGEVDGLVVDGRRLPELRDPSFVQGRRMATA